MKWREESVTYRWKSRTPHLQVGNHVISARLKVDSSNGNMLPCGFISGEIYGHQII